MPWILFILLPIVSGFGVFAFRGYFAGGVCRSKRRLDGKTVLITGGNSGIGKETAKHLARRGARVVIACRDVEKAETVAEELRAQTGNLDIVVRKLDLASLECVRSFADNFLRTEMRLDILINNAGVCATPASWRSSEGYELQLAVNHLSHFLLTHLLLPRLKESGPSRVITLSSSAHESGDIQLDDINHLQNYTPFGAYCQSKLANLLFTRELHKRIQDSSVTCYAVHPGFVNSNLARYAHMVFPSWYIALFKPFMWTTFKTCEQGAQTSLYCALQEDIEEHSGKYFSDCKVKEPSSRAQDDRLAEDLWTLSLKMCKLDSLPQSDVQLDMIAQH